MDLARSSIGLPYQCKSQRHSKLVVLSVQRADGCELVPTLTEQLRGGSSPTVYTETRHAETCTQGSSGAGPGMGRPAVSGSEEWSKLGTGGTWPDWVTGLLEQPISFSISTEDVYTSISLFIYEQGSSENDGRSDVNDHLELRNVSNCCYPNCCRTNCSHFLKLGNFKIIEYCVHGYKCKSIQVHRRIGEYLDA